MDHPLVVQHKSHDFQFQGVQLQEAGRDFAWKKKEHVYCQIPRRPLCFRWDKEKSALLASGLYVERPSSLGWSWSDLIIGQNGSNQTVPVDLLAFLVAENVDLQKAGLWLKDWHLREISGQKQGAAVIPSHELTMMKGGHTYM